MPLAPEYQALLAELEGTPAARFSSLSVQEARDVYRTLRPLGGVIGGERVEERAVPRGDGDIPIRIYTPPGDGPFGIVVNFHGGGWVVGDLDTSDVVCRRVCADTPCVVVSVDYRLAPENAYPAATEDAYVATSWVAAHAASLGGNGRLALLGESAGGNLAAGVALKAREENGPAIDLQALAYPVVDCSLERASYTNHGEGYLLETATMGWFWDLYCPDLESRTQWRASPLRTPSLSGVAPAFVLTAEFDPLRDEGLAYAARLREAGVEVASICFDGLIHDFLATAELLDCARGAMNQLIAGLRAALRLRAS